MKSNSADINFSWMCVCVCVWSDLSPRPASTVPAPANNFVEAVPTFAAAQHTVADTPRKPGSNTSEVKTFVIATDETVFFQYTVWKFEINSKEKLAYPISCIIIVTFFNQSLIVAYLSKSMMLYVKYVIQHNSECG